VDTRFKVLISAPKSKHLSSEQCQFLQGIKRKLTSAGLRAVDPDEGRSLENYASEMLTIQGVIALAFGQWQGQRLVRKTDEAIFPTEFTHLHIALATTERRPLLIIKNKNVSERGALRPNLGYHIVKIPSSWDQAWLDDPDSEFQKPFQEWLKKVQLQNHVFLGYCSKAQATADAIQLFLTKTLGLRVMDWAMDFTAGRTIIEQIENANNLCCCGIFLFTKDDPMKGQEDRAAPRDNVVFEAGYFAAKARGKKRVLIIREEDAKMPADLDGIIYLPLMDRGNITSIHERLRQALDTVL
jgi:hypothetical protein